METSKLALVWFLLASVVVVWDALFVLLRPRSMPGGDLHAYFQPYALYIWVDEIYGNMEDTFGIAQSWMNLVEVVFNLATVTLLLRKVSGALLCGFFVSALTFWKTVLYFLQFSAICGGSYRVAHLSWSQYVFLFLIPNGVWLVFPAYFILSYGSKILAILGAHKEKKN